MKERKFCLSIFITFLTIAYGYLKLYDIFEKKYLYIYLIAICILFFINEIYINKKVGFKYISISCIAIFITFISNDANFLLFYVLANIYNEDNYNKMIRDFVLFSIVFFCATIVFSNMGIIKNSNYYRNGNLRFSMGFGTANGVFLYYMPIGLGSYFMIKNKKIYLLISIITSCCLFALSDSRNGFLCIIIFYIYVALFRNSRIVKKFLDSHLYKNLFLIFFVLTLIIAQKYGQSFNNEINTLFTGRPYYWNLNIQEYNLFSIFGNNIAEYKYTLDNSYLVIMLECGVSVFILYYLIIKNMVKYLDYDEKMVLLIFLIYGLFESNAFIGSINFIMPILLLKYFKGRKDTVIYCNHE